MSDPATDVVEYALRGHFGAPEPRDVTWRVLRELRRSHAGVRARRRVSRRAALAAAVLVASSLAATLLLRDAAPTVARSARSVAVHDADGVATPATALPPGTIVLAPIATRVELPRGIRVDASPGSVFRWSAGAPALELFAGALDVHAGADALVVASPTGRLELAARGRARFEVAPASDLVSRTRLARSLAMNLRLSALAPTVTATLLAGSGTLLCGGPPHVLAPERPTTVDPAYGTEPVPAAPDDENPFELEPGTWDLYEPHDAPRPTGVEVVRVGPHPHSLLIDMTATEAGSTRAAHVVLKYEADRGRITGSLVDSFGGPIGVLRGTLDDEGARVLELHRVDGQPFGMRMTTRWVHDDERRTLLETQEDGAWRRVQETRHVRRDDAPGDGER